MTSEVIHEWILLSLGLFLIAIGGITSMASVPIGISAILLVLYSATQRRKRI